MSLENFRKKRQFFAINSDGSRNANYAYNGIDLVGCLLERRGKNLPPGAVRSAPGDGILCSVHARSESSRLTVGSCYRISDNAS